jgi:hypothetical protein
VQDHFLQFSVRDRHKPQPKLADLQRCTQFAADHVAILFNGPQVPTLSEQGLELVRSMPICDFTMVWKSFLQHVNTSKLRKYPAVATKFVEVTLTTLRSYSSSSMGYVQVPYFTAEIDALWQAHAQPVLERAAQRSGRHSRRLARQQQFSASEASDSSGAEAGPYLGFDQADLEASAAGCAPNLLRVERAGSKRARFGLAGHRWRHTSLSQTPAVPQEQQEQQQQQQLSPWGPSRSANATGAAQMVAQAVHPQQLQQVYWRQLQQQQQQPHPQGEVEQHLGPQAHLAGAHAAAAGPGRCARSPSPALLGAGLDAAFMEAANLAGVAGVYIWCC